MQCRQIVGETWGRKPSMMKWIYVQLCRNALEMARITKNASACCAASANFVRMLHRTAFKHN